MVRVLLMSVFVWLWTCLGKTRLGAEELQSSQAPKQVPWSKSLVFRPEAQVGPEGTIGLSAAGKEGYRRGRSGRS